MKRQTATILAFILTTFLGCKNERKFAALKTLSEFKNTQFIPTLENKISNDKNSVYCATFLLAWNEIRKQINPPLTISDQYFDLKLLDQSTFFENVLKGIEYNVTGEVKDGLISARAEFNKSLHFEPKLQSFNNQLSFDRQKVASFGVNGYDNYEQLKIVQIVYYKNDNNFIIKLLPKDKEHEIILFKTGQKFNSIADMTKEIEQLSKIGKAEKENEKTDRSGNSKPESNGSSKDMQKETIENLQEAFKGETTASAKYAAYSKKAEQEGYHQIALLFKAASTAEKIHANNHKAVLQESGVNTPVIKPAFSVKTTKENLQDAITGESYEATTMYPQFMNTANKADNQLAMITFNYAYKTEKKHKALYESALTALQNNAVNSLATVFYICPTCGNTYETKAPSRCGISMTSGEKFIKINTI